ncbi:hypothetical protein [Shewanella sedimentimangrovi]|uniref:SnoaL-like domain-containing protein n=1 Tax=Shewanella sedimentimangrovi TaxID=2814293 RepID=A0ABX7R4Z3_9GAMM|nr:hypothetical protein [Shewanella sedimentimangrovi]QSX38231.1 hypothetical protein JYB85_05240 [Shewanella sedimentimangrovi]
MKNYIFGCVVFASSFFAQAGDAESFIGDYLSDFAKGSDLSGYFVEKPQFIFGPHTHVPESAADAAVFIKEIRTKLAESHYGKSNIDKTKVLASIDNYNLITFSLTRLKIDGSELDKVCSTYGVLQTEAGYRILSWQPSKTDTNGGC